MYCMAIDKYTDLLICIVMVCAWGEEKQGVHSSKVNSIVNRGNGVLLNLHPGGVRLETIVLTEVSPHLNGVLN